MPNPTGKNSPSSFDEFAPTTPYGGREKANALQKSAPVAGDGARALGSARRATEVALKAGQKNMEARAQPQANEPAIPPEQAPPAAADPFQLIWAAAAAQPGASSLVKEYASMV